MRGTAIIKAVLLVVLVCMTVGSAWAQTKWTREQKKQLSEADFYTSITDYRAALHIYNQLLLEIPDDPNLHYRAGYAIYKQGIIKLRAIPHFEQAVKGDKPEALYYLGQCYHLLEEFGPAIKYYQKYKNHLGVKEFASDEVDRAIEVSLRAEDMIMQHSGADIFSLGASVNSEFPDYVPLVSMDGKQLFFTSRRPGPLDSCET